MNIQLIDCPYCDGVGRLEDRKGNEYTCPDCRGKGTVYAPEKSEATNENDQAD